MWYKQALLYFKPITLVVARLILSFPLLLISGILLKRLKKVKWKDLPVFLLLAFFEPFLYFTGESYGMQYVSSTVASILIATIPLFTSVAAFFLLNEKLRLNNYLGMVISFIGVIAVILADSDRLVATWRGIGFMMIAVFSALAYGFIVKRISGKYNAITIVSVQNSVASIYFLPLLLVFDLDDILTQEWELSMFIPVIYLAFFASTLAYLGFIEGLRKLGVSKATAFTNFIPVFTAIFAFIILRESITWLKVAGISLVIFGLIMSQAVYKSSKRKSEDIIVDELY